MKMYQILVPIGQLGAAGRFEEAFIQMHETLMHSKIALEIIADAQNISFCISGDQHSLDIASSHIYGVVPDAIIRPVGDPYQHTIESFSGYELRLIRSDLFPLKDFRDFGGESLTNVLSAMTRCAPGERSCIQIVISPQKDSWFHQALLKARKACLKVQKLLWIKYWFKRDVAKTFGQKIAEKTSSRLFRTSIRIASIQEGGKPQGTIEVLKQAVSNFNTLDYNKIRFIRISSKYTHEFLLKRLLYSPFLLSSKELAAWFHFPSEDEAPNLVRVLSKREAPPRQLPTDLKKVDGSLFGETNFRDQKTPFGILEEDRRRHLYIVGKSGSGKSKLLEQLIRSDIEHGRGLAVLDPHGDLVDNVLRSLTRSRLRDVVIFNPADLDFPPSFNPLEQVPEALKMRVTIGFIEIFKKLFGSNWSPRLEHVLRYTTLALLDTPNTTVLSILKMLSHKEYRQSIVKNIQDKVVKNFWVNEFAGWSEKFDAEAITPLVNKVGQFVSTNMIRNIVGQPENRFNFRNFMDTKKIVLMKVSKGILGEENASLLGAMVVTKIFQAAMSRADIPEEERVPFSLYVDEFHNFATSTFGEILSEARKYGLSLTLANQFLGQLDPVIRKTVFGNVGSLVSFRLGSEDAALMAQEFSPRFSGRDIINLAVREFCMKMSITGHVTEAFSARTLNITYPKEHHAGDAIAFSRKEYAKPLKAVEEILSNWESEVQKNELNIRSAANGETFEEPLV